jgi:hypothetical protein
MESSRGGFLNHRHIVQGPLGVISVSDFSREDWIVLASNRGRQNAPPEKGTKFGVTSPPPKGQIPDMFNSENIHISESQVLPRFLKFLMNFGSI